MLNIRPLSILIIFSFFSGLIHAQQVVHIEDKRADQDREGFSGKAEIGYDVTISETEFYQLNKS
jgi:hypothetical protein